MNNKNDQIDKSVQEEVEKTELWKLLVQSIANRTWEIFVHEETPNKNDVP